MLWQDKNLEGRLVVLTAARRRDEIARAMQQETDHNPGRMGFPKQKGFVSEKEPLFVFPAVKIKHNTYLYLSLEFHTGTS
jgi:hypothetical protein